MPSFLVVLENLLTPWFCCCLLSNDASGMALEALVSPSGSAITSASVLPSASAPENIGLMRTCHQTMHVYSKSVTNVVANLNNTGTQTHN